MTPGAPNPNPKDLALLELECNWFDIGNWRWSCDPDREQYYPNQWWEFHALTIYALPTLPSIDGVVAGIDKDITDALRMHKIVCHPLAVQAVERLSLRCHEVTDTFPNATYHIILSSGKLLVPPRVAH